MLRTAGFLLIVSLILLYGCIFSSNGKEGFNNDEAASETSFPISKKEVICFVYHRFGNDEYPSTNISLEDFESHLKYLKAQGFTVMDLGHAIAYLSDNDKPMIPNVAVITVDDGFKTFKSGAMPLLKKYGYTATLFINTETVGGGSYMNWKDLKSVKDAGIQIGNHSHSHPYFLNTPKKQRIAFLKQEVSIAQKLIKKHLGLLPDLFAYPYGEFDPEMEQALKSMGFKAAAAQNSGVIWSGSDPYAVPRFPMAGSYSKLKDFQEKANMKALPVTKESPKSFMLKGQNPPLLTIEIDGQGLGLDFGRLGCFVQGGNCAVDIKQNGKTTVQVHAKNPLTRRRTLYTITVPSKDNSHWYWYSHLWIRPEIR